MVRRCGGLSFQAVVILLNVLLATGTSPADAREPGGYPLPISVVNCERDPSQPPFSAAGALSLPTGCSHAGGVIVVVTTADNRPLGSCTTDTRGSCRVPVPYDSLVIVGEAITTVPAGYVPLANPILTWVYTEFAGAGFANVPAPPVDNSARDDSATLTVHSRVCARGYAGHDYFGACHDTPPSYAQLLFLSGPEYRARGVDGFGNATLPDLTPGTYHLRAGLPADTTGVVVFCAAAATPGVEYPSETTHSPATPPNDYRTTITLRPHDRIVCDLYAIHRTPPSDVPVATTAPIDNHAVVANRVLTCPAGYAGGTFETDCAAESRSGVTLTFRNRKPGDTAASVTTDDGAVATVELVYRQLPYAVTVDLGGR